MQLLLLCAALMRAMGPRTFKIWLVSWVLFMAFVLFLFLRA